MNVGTLITLASFFLFGTGLEIEFEKVQKATAHETETVQVETKEEKLNRIAYAVAVSETGNCTKGSGVSKNNCFGIMGWKDGKRFLRKYETKEASFYAFKKIWEEKYGGEIPNEKTAWKWVCGANAKTCPEAEIWLKNVKENL